MNKSEKGFTYSVSQRAEQEKYNRQHDPGMRSQPVPNCMGLDGMLICSPQACCSTIIRECVSMNGVPCDSGGAYAVEQDIGGAKRACGNGCRSSDIIYSAARLAWIEEK